MGKFLKEVDKSSMLQFLEKELPSSIKIHHASKLQDSGAIDSSTTKKWFTNADDSKWLVILRENHIPDSDDRLTITIYCKETKAKEVWNILSFWN